jgi:hypothetical protein
MSYILLPFSIKLVGFKIVWLKVILIIDLFRDAGSPFSDLPCTIPMHCTLRDKPYVPFQKPWFQFSSAWITTILLFSASGCKCLSLTHFLVALKHRQNAVMNSLLPWNWFVALSFHSSKSAVYCTGRNTKVYWTGNSNEEGCWVAKGYCIRLVATLAPD